MEVPTSHAKDDSQRLTLGIAAGGMAAFDYYRPSLLEFSSDVVKAECMAGPVKKLPIETPIPMPMGRLRHAPRIRCYWLSPKYTLCVSDGYTAT